MKRLGMVIGVWFVVSVMPVWAQTVTAASAKLQAEEAAARARVQEATEKGRAEERKQAEAALAAAVAARQRGASNVELELQKALKLQTPLVFNSTGTNYSFQWNTSRSNDPLAALQVAPGTWWNNADTVTRLSLTKEQQLKMDDIFQKFRLTLIDLNASLSREELIMDPLIGAERLDEVKILTQIDRIAQARAELEKANSRMLLAIRQSLTMEQWTKIQASPGTYRVITKR